MTPLKCPWLWHPLSSLRSRGHWLAPSRLRLLYCNNISYQIVQDRASYRAIMLYLWRKGEGIFTKTIVTLFKEYYDAFMFIHHNIHYARSCNNNIQHSYWCSTPWSHPWGYSLQLEKLELSTRNLSIIQNIIHSILGLKSLKFDLTLNADGPQKQIVSSSSKFDWGGREGKEVLTKNFAAPWCVK